MLFPHFRALDAMVFYVSSPPASLRTPTSIVVLVVVLRRRSLPIPLLYASAILMDVETTFLRLVFSKLKSYTGSSDATGGTIY